MFPDPLLNEPVSDPLPLYRYRDGIGAVDLLSAAVAHLDFFSWVGDHPATLGAICAQFEIHPRPADVMMTLFSAMGLITQSGGVFHLTIRAREHLTQASPWNLAPYYFSMKDRPATIDMLKVLKSGKPANWGGYDPQAWAQAMEREDFARQFTEAMDCRGVLLGPALAKKIDLSERHAVLDIAGGSAIYSCAIVARHPHVRAAVFEKPPVDHVARAAIERRGFAGKVYVIAGDMFKDPWPSDFDVHLISNVLHDWDEPEVKDLLRKSHAALPSKGLLVIHDAFINADKTGPLHVAEYSALLMNITEGKCYSLGEMRGYLGECGFDFLDHQTTAVSRSFILAQKI
ncbi:MAG TPA: methyltransferase [Chthoniobacteraceae bacterium]|nr:methyltransferase [Chthoniobacteraceae bacterium]